MEKAAVDMCLLDVDKRFNSLGLGNRYNGWLPVSSIQSENLNCVTRGIRLVLVGISFVAPD